METTPEIPKINLEAVKEEPPIRFYCTRCTRKFKTIEKRDIHETGHDNNNKCAKCKYQLKSIHAYEKHVGNCLAKPSPKFICNICGKEVASKLNLNGHLATHKKTNSSDDSSSDEKIEEQPQGPQVYFYCTRCSRKFKTKAKRDIHESGHENHYKCARCGYQLKTSENYEKHVGRCTGPYKSNKTFICSFCGKIASTKANLNSHIATHGDFRCEICDLNFDQKLKFRSHMLIHETGKTIECNICGKKFGRSSNFYNHQRIHLGLKKFKCRICGSGFIKQSNLESHYNLKHSEELKQLAEPSINPVISPDEKFECRICGLTKESNLEEHYNLHHQNDVSDRVVAQGSIQKPVVNLVISYTPKINCKICRSGYKEPDLKMHYNLHHPGIDPTKPFKPPLELGEIPQIQEDERDHLPVQHNFTNPEITYSQNLSYFQLNQLNIPSWSVDSSKQTNL